MFNRLALTFGALLFITGCGPAVVVDDPYESCQAGDECSVAGFACSGSTLPQASYTGNFCTTGCAQDTDCPEDVSGFATVCVLYAQGQGQCYVTCPAGNTCPYGQGCFTYSDGFTGAPVNLCTP